MTSSAPTDDAVPDRLPVRLHVIGAFDVEIGGQPAEIPRQVSRKARTLLKLLAVDAGHLVSTDRAVDALWGQDPPAKPVENVATLVSRLRSWLGPSAIDGGREGYRLGTGVEVDLDVAERLTTRAEQALAQGQSGLALVPAEQACALLARGRALEDEPYAEWAQAVGHRQVPALRRARLAHAKAALAAGLQEPALVSAAAGVRDDLLDEEMVRLVMSAHHDAGQPARALAAYAALREALADELGTDPAPETEELHAALLRAEPLPAPASSAEPTRAAAGAADTAGLVQREQELAQLRAAWGAAAAGQTSLLLVVGEAGIGKTAVAEALATEVAATGGRVLRARCYEAERSLLLQPLVDALTPSLAAIPPYRLREMAGGHVESLSALVPAAALALGPAVAAGAPPEETRRLAFEAVLHLLRRMSDETPVLLLLDDLHNAGTTTVEALHYVARRGVGARLLVVGTVRREEGASALAALADVSTSVEPAMLSEPAVRQLARRAGLTDQAAEIARSTRGHPFFVVEVLRGLAAGDEALPESLHAAVLTRVARAGADVERTLRAASVFAAEVDPVTVAAMLGVPPDDAARRCEEALAARLLTVSERAYEFANDLIREVLYESTPAPTRLAWHRQAADLAGDSYEAMAHHADAAGDKARAARAWLLAAEAASARFAASDAVGLATRAADAASTSGSPEVLGRALLVRARAQEARGRYAEALDDLRAVAEGARETGDQRLEMTAQRELAGDVPVGLALGSRFADPFIDRGLVLARSLGDHSMEADLLARRAVLASNRLELRDAIAAGEAAVSAARSADDPVALLSALDGLKTALTFVGDVTALRAVLDELEPRLRQRNDLWRLQWCVFESAYPAVAEADWARAEERMRAALEINRRSGYLAYGTWYEAHLGWLLRQMGRYDEALAFGRRAVASTAEETHPWWRAISRQHLAGTLVELGERAEARDLLDEGLAAAKQDGAEAYVLGCLALLAEVTEDPSVLVEADEMVRAVQAPDGQVWLMGADSYLSIARAWLAAGDTTRAEEVLVPLVAAARSQGWRSVTDRAAAVEAAIAG